MVQAMDDRFIRTLMEFKIISWFFSEDKSVLEINAPVS